MINLAGNQDADKTIREELYLANISFDYVPLGNTEVPYRVIGRLGKWTFRRSWYYWVASVEHREDGLPLKPALLLYNKPSPTNPDNILGKIIRSGGHGEGLSPDKFGAQPIYNVEFNNQLKTIGQYQEIELFGKMMGPTLNVGEISELCNSGKITVERYVDCYHIDSQIGLTEFAKFINNLEEE